MIAGAGPAAEFSAAALAGFRSLRGERIDRSATALPGLGRKHLAGRGRIRGGPPLFQVAHRLFGSVAKTEGAVIHAQGFRLRDQFLGRNEIVFRHRLPRSPQQVVGLRLFARGVDVRSILPEACRPSNTAASPATGPAELVDAKSIKAAAMEPVINLAVILDTALLFVTCDNPARKGWQVEDLRDFHYV